MLVQQLLTRQIRPSMGNSTCRCVVRRTCNAYRPNRAGRCPSQLANAPSAWLPGPSVPRERVTCA